MHLALVTMEDKTDKILKILQDNDLYNLPDDLQEVYDDYFAGGELSDSDLDDSDDN